MTEVSIPSLDYALPAYYVISSAEASSNLARFDGVQLRLSRRGVRRTWTELYLKTPQRGLWPGGKAADSCWAPTP